MKLVVELFLFAFAVTGTSGAQEPAKPALRQGVSVEMPTANHAVEMPAADEDGATVVSISADGQMFVGAQPVDLGSLGSLKKWVVYVKADARVAYQTILAVLDALQGRSVALLTAPLHEKSANIVPPYGLKVTVAQQ